MEKTRLEKALEVFNSCNPVEKLTLACELRCSKDAIDKFVIGVNNWFERMEIENHRHMWE